ncbi:hypothetical protein LCGC14_0368580 [marine sediment metagenome]|uniref:Uncharacterized protein n=1 Tax=marine sediment metagenome TaxID=412755 RepID=A0A0F9VT56_9ZZZZ
MTQLVCLDGTVFRLTAAATWGWGASTPSTPNFANFVDISITGTGSNLTVDGTKIILEADVTSTMTTYTDSYHIAGAAGTGGGVYLNVSPLTAGVDGTVLAVTLTSGLTLSTIFRHGTNGVILDSLTGNFSIPATVFAMFPQPPPPAGSPVPSTVTPLTGTWAIQSNGGNTKLKSN